MSFLRSELVNGNTAFVGGVIVSCRYNNTTYIYECLTLTFTGIEVDEGWKVFRIKQILVF